MARRFTGHTVKNLEAIIADTIDGISGADPCPAMTIAEAVIQAVCSRIVKTTKSEGVPGQVYLAYS